MNTLELLYNKALMKAAASQDEHIKKAKVWENLERYFRLIYIYIWIKLIFSWYLLYSDWMKSKNWVI